MERFLEIENIIGQYVNDEDGVVFLNEDFCSYFLELVEECI